MKKVFNFSSGPSILPREVFEKAAAGVLDLNGSGLSILEISHRSKDFRAILDKAETLVRELLHVPDSFEVLFLSGGASGQFYMTAMNLLGPGKKAAFIDTGVWSAKAIKEAAKFGEIEVIASSKSSGYSEIPKHYTIANDCEYLHYTSNNTIYGTRFTNPPKTNLPLVCDMSSDIFSQPVDFKKFGLIYAGAQKNMGPAGVALVIVRKDLLGKSGHDLPSMLDYSIQVKNGSMFNTPPTFPIYVSMLNLEWLKKQGGIEVISKRNKEKACLLYEEIDRNTLFENKVKKEFRSYMNVVFDATDLELEEGFLTLCEDKGISGIKGHRIRGGFRASIYNAMPLEGVEALIKVMQKYEMMAS